jgi:hypothetical protein
VNNRVQNISIGIKENEEFLINGIPDKPKPVKKAKITIRIKN